MKKYIKSFIGILIAVCLVVSLVACSRGNSKIDTTKILEKYPNAMIVELSGDVATFGGEQVKEYDYTWHCDPTTVHDDVKDSPAEYYTGEKPSTDDAIYVDHELYYYPSLDEDGFKLVNYDGEQEWAYYYNDGENIDYIFSTLPHLGQSLPKDMMHTEEEASQNKVLHITKAGTYVLMGEWNGQIKVNLGDKDDIFADENAKVTLVLNGVTVNCSVASGIVFESVYECDNTWEDKEKYSVDVDTQNAGANIIIADDTENSITGTNTFRMLKTKYKDEDSKDEIKTQKKARKLDGALYSYMSMNIDAEEKQTGTLDVTSGFEGIDSELHLSFLGGNITINSQDDGINVNEDNVSVVGFYGGKITINSALGEEGDGVDSNGYVKIDGAEINVNGIKVPDNAIDSEDGVYYESGKVVIDGEEQSLEAGSTAREIGGKNDGFASGQKPDGNEPPNANQNGAPMEKPDGENPMGQDFDIKEFKEKVAGLPDDATFDDVMDLLGMNKPNK